MLEFAGRIPFRMNIGNLLEFERTFQRNRIVTSGVALSMKQSK